MRSSKQPDAKQKILIAAVGNSPAILTETVWTLAHQDEPWIPDQVVTITTRTGKAAAEKTLLLGKGWDRLCEALSARPDQLAFGSRDSIRVIGDGRNDFDDIRTPAESAVAADFLLGVLRQYTEQPDTEIVASIAGGRKTMSALMLACMSLLGRAQDRVCHVLVDDEFIALNPDFLFPLTTKELKDSGLQLCDIPFVRVRGWYEKEYAGVPPSYMTLVRRFAEIAPRPESCPMIVLDVRKGTVRVAERLVDLSSGEFLVLMTLLQGVKNDLSFRAWPDVEEPALHIISTLPVSVAWCAPFRGSRSMDSEDFRKWAASARAKFRRDFGNAGWVARLLPSMRGQRGEIYPAGRIQIDDVSGRQKRGNINQL